MKRSSTPLAIVGAGRAGLALGAALARAGHAPHACVTSTPSSARRASRILGAGRGTTSYRKGLAAARVVLLCVPDASIAVVAQRLAPLAGDRCFLHTSGSLGPDILAPLRRTGAACGAMHPLYSFPPAGEPAPDLRGVLFAVDGDPEARACARRLVRILGGIPHHVPPRHRAAYHLAASIVANDLVALLDLGFSLASRRLRLTPAEVRRAFLPLARAAIDNVARFGTRRGLTGPAARGDAATLATHRDALRHESRNLEAVHLILTLHAVDLAEMEGRLDRRTAESLRRLLSRPRNVD